MLELGQDGDGEDAAAQAKPPDGSHRRNGERAGALFGRQRALSDGPGRRIEAMDILVSPRRQAEGNGPRFAAEGRDAGEGARPSRRSAGGMGGGATRWRRGGKPSKRRREFRRSGPMRSPSSSGSKTGSPTRSIASNGRTRCKPIARRSGRRGSIASTRRACWNALRRSGRPSRKPPRGSGGGLNAS